MIITTIPSIHAKQLIAAMCLLLKNSNRSPSVSSFMRCAERAARYKLLISLTNRIVRRRSCGEIPPAAGIVPNLRAGRRAALADLGTFLPYSSSAGGIPLARYRGVLITVGEDLMRYGLSVASIATMILIAGPAFAQNQAAVEKGMKVFADQKCSLCHSVAGKGNSKGPLEDGVAKLSADEIRQWLVNPQEMRDKTGADRKPVMKSFATLPKADLDALVAYLSSLKKK
jgi:mono/diheme cytochrome c family protein